MSSNEWLNMLMTFVIACVSTAILTPFSIRLAYKIGALDIPKDERKIHSKPMPRIGGTAFIIGSFIATLIVFIFCNIDRSVNFQEINLWGFYAGALIIAIVGFLDDINVSSKGLRPTVKLLGQVLAAICVVLSGARILYIDIPFLETYGFNDIISIVITICWIVGVTNAINLLDGLDGLASGVSAIAILSLLAIFVLNGSPQIVLILVAGLLRRFNRVSSIQFQSCKNFYGRCWF